MQWRCLAGAQSVIGVPEATSTSKGPSLFLAPITFTTVAISSTTATAPASSSNPPPSATVITPRSAIVTLARKSDDTGIRRLVAEDGLATVQPIADALRAAKSPRVMPSTATSDQLATVCGFASGSSILQLVCGDSASIFGMELRKDNSGSWHVDSASFAGDAG
jgi:hypothetical protein